MKIDQVFDELFDDYTAKILRWVPCYKNMVANITDYLPNDFSPRQILDLGCGNGNTTQVISQKYPEAHYTLVDASEEMIAGCQQRFTNLAAIDFQQQFFQNLNFPENHFDLVTTCLSIHHLEEAEKKDFFPKIARWLKPKGLFIYSDLMIEKTDLPFHDEHMQQWKKDAFLQGTSEEEWQYLMDHYEAYDRPSDLEKQIDWLKSSGFKSVKISFRKIGWTSILAEK